MDETLHPISFYEIKTEGGLLGGFYGQWPFIFLKNHIKIILMRGETLFWTNPLLVIELIKPSHFWQITDFVLLQHHRTDSEFATFWPRELQM